jgi:lysophospholipase L1-like esterase
MGMKRSGWFILAVAFGAFAGSSVATAQKPIGSPPKKFIVALGDSLAFGFQQIRFNENPDPSNFTGFVDVFTQMVNETPPGKFADAVNFGCPGETSTSLLSGPCAYHVEEGFPLHVNYDGAQIDAATAFIAAHPGRVGTVIVDIGSNDLLALVDSCGGTSNLQCIAAGLPSVIATLVANYTEILSRLRAVAPQAVLLVVQLYNPLAIVDPASNILLPPINDAIASVAQSFNAALANPFPGINLAPPQPETLCDLTLICTPLMDIHLSDAGYEFVGGLLFQASGYERFAP